MKNFIDRLVFFIGWVLSPLTFWNDVFVNIPISYITANLLIRFIRADFALIVLIVYWITNAAGLVLMAVSGREIFKKGKGMLRELLYLVFTVAGYSLILLILARMGILKPITVSI